jgi:4-amino-4-deoxy-L-arabinose transferase-like glycosyltransferase
MRFTVHKSWGFSVAALGLAATALVGGLKYGTYVAGGSDSYGYVSQSDLWYQRQLSIEQPWVKDVPWPGGQWVFAPLGYRPAAGRQSTEIVPTYAPGLPMLMAAGRAIGGPCAVFWIVPLSGAVLVLATFGLGRALASPVAGLIAAGLVLTSPVFLFMLMTPMTDVPVAAAWAAALWLLLAAPAGASPARLTTRAAGAGLACAVAILIRPNLVTVLPSLTLWFLFRALGAERSAWRRALMDGLVFAAAASTGAVAVAAINQNWYGSAFMSGYGAASTLFSTANVWPNLVQYTAWFRESQTLWPLAGFAALAAPVAMLWPAARSRAAVITLAAFAFVATLSYLVYGVYDAWWYLRFLLPVWPALMIGFAAILGAAGRRRRWIAWSAAIVVIGLGARNVVFARDHSAFRLWKEERRYATVGQLVRGATEPSSVIFAIQHSGSLRRYAGRLTIRFDSVDDGWLDQTIAWLSARGIASYLLVEDWEVPRFLGKFRSQEAVSRVNGAPLVEYTGNGQTLLYDLRETRDPSLAVTRIVERWDGPRCPAVAPPPSGLLR